MRRESDIRSHNRSGRGRRARDLLLTGDPPADAAELAGVASSDVDNLLMFVADDLRESALSLSNIESQLVAVHQLLGDGELTGADVEGAMDGDLDGRLDALTDALGSLQRSLQRLRAALPAPTAPAVLARVGSRDLEPGVD